MTMAPWTLMHDRYVNKQVKFGRNGRFVTMLVVIS